MPADFRLPTPLMKPGNLATLTYPGNKTVTYTYDALNRLKTVTDWMDRTATYDYDPGGRLESMTQFNGTVITYSYDNANRLTGLDNLTASGGDAIATYQFTLDGNGNRTQVTREVPLDPDLTATTKTFYHQLHGQPDRKRRHQHIYI